MINKSFETKHCKNFYCIVCNFIFNNKFLTVENGFVLPILCNANFNSTNVIYIIICVKCYIYYVSQTKRKFPIRFKEHIRNICNLDFCKVNSEISFHFDKKKHDLHNDLKFIIYKDNITDENLRLSFETDLIHILLSLRFTVINQLIPSLFYIKKLSFLA